MRQLNARLRIDRVSDAESRELPVDVGHVVRTQEVSLWQTDAGPIDVLHGLRDRDGQQHDYRDLQARAVTLQIGEHRVQLASLDDLIAAKEWAGRPKDREVVDELRSLRANQSSFAESAGRRDDQTPDSGPRRPAAPPSGSPRPKR